MTAGEQTTTELTARIDALQSTVAALEKQIGRAGREQLKANALAETQAERLDAALEALHATEAQREAEARAADERARAAVAEARLAVAQRMFPVLDGLDEALRSGHAAMAHAARGEQPGDLLRRLLLGGEERRPDPALRNWLDGLTIVRRRLLDALAAEGVTPIAAEGRPFDPHRHLAVEVADADAPPGTVTQVIRRGFLAGERVLRHAEVAVAGERRRKEPTL